MQMAIDHSDDRKARTDEIEMRRASQTFFFASVLALFAPSRLNWVAKRIAGAVVSVCFCILIEADGADDTGGE
jgi:hypothetical protein